MRPKPVRIELRPIRLARPDSIASVPEPLWQLVPELRRQWVLALRILPELPHSCSTAEPRRLPAGLGFTTVVLRLAPVRSNAIPQNDTNGMPPRISARYLLRAVLPLRPAEPRAAITLP